MNHFPAPVKVVFTAFFLSLGFWAAFSYGKVPAITDVFLHTYSSQNANLTAISQGSVPLWDPAVGCGTPQLASGLGACFYPAYWLWNFTGLSYWMVWMSLLHSAFAFGGFYLWARSQKIFPLWAALGALSFAGSLHMVRLWGYPIFLSSQAWTPWIFWAASRFLEEGRFRWGMALALAVGLQVLAGYPFFSFYALLFLSGWALIQPSGNKRKMELGLAIACAFAWTAVHWLPFLDFLRFASRDHWGSPENFPYFSKGIEYLTLLNPTALGKPETVGYAGQAANANYMMYFGLIPLAAWLGGLLLEKFPGWTFWFSASWFWLVWLMGARFFLWKALPVPFLETLNPSKAVGVFIFAACTCAGLTLTRFFRDRWDEKKRLAVGWVLCGLWMLDLFFIPVRVLHWVPDPFLKPEIRQWAQEVKTALGGGRLLSLRAKDKTITRGGDEKVFEAAADAWVGELLANSQQIWGIRSVQAYLSLWTGSMDQLWKAFNQKETYAGSLADVAGLRLLYFPIELPAPHYRTLRKAGENYLIENQYWKGDAWPAQEGEALGSQGEIAALLLRGAGGREWDRTVLLEKDKWLSPGTRRLKNLSDQDPDGFNRTGGSRARYKGGLTGAKWLVFSETFAPGWKAWVDGEPVPIQRAFGFWMAVPLGPSAGRVDFHYEPAAFRAGLFISLMSLVLGLAGLGFKGFSRWAKRGSITPG